MLGVSREDCHSWRVPLGSVASNGAFGRTPELFLRVGEHLPIAASPCGTSRAASVPCFLGGEQSPEGRAEWRGAVQHCQMEEPASPRPVSCTPQGPSPASLEQPPCSVEHVTKKACVLFSIYVYIQLCFGNEAELLDFIERCWYLEVAKPHLLLPAAEGVVKKKTKGINPSQRTDHKGLIGAKTFQQISARPEVHRSLTLTGFGVWLFWGTAALCGRALMGWMQTGKQVGDRAKSPICPGNSQDSSPPLSVPAPPLGTAPSPVDSTRAHVAGLQEQESL